MKLRTTLLCLIVCMLSSQGFAQDGWVGQGQVNRPDSLHDSTPRIAIDNQGNPWVVWIGAPWLGAEPQIYFTKWNGRSWKEEGQVNTPDSTGNFKPAIAIDSGDNIWVVWSHSDGPYPAHDNIFYTRWNGSGWEPQLQVNQPNSRYDYSPWIAVGGSEVWVVWYAGFDPPAPYKVFVSRWNGADWDLEFMLTETDTSDDWFSNIAVDTSGRPHVVWGEYYTQILYYSTYDGITWSAPLPLNDPEVIPTGYWPAPSIAIDDSGDIHLVWVGRELSTGGDWDIFYSKYDDSGWSEPVMINQDDSLQDSYPEIAVSGPDDIWVVWDKEVSFWDCHIWYTHFDGQSWSDEQRLDSDESYCNLGAEVALDRDGYPWVVWSGIDGESFEIYFNRYTNNKVERNEGQPCLPQLFNLFQNYPNPFNPSTTIPYHLSAVGSRPSAVTLKVYNILGQEVRTLMDESQRAGHYSVVWDGRDSSGKEVSSGIYFCRLEVKGDRLKVIKTKRMALIR